MIFDARLAAAQAERGDLMNINILRNNPQKNLPYRLFKKIFLSLNKLF